MYIILFYIPVHTTIILQRMTPPPTVYITLKVAFHPRELVVVVGAMAEDSLEERRRRREMERRARSRKRREQLIRDVCEEVGVEEDEEVQRELLAGVETMNMNFVNKREEGLNVIEKPNDNAVGDDKIVEKDKEDDGFEDEDILTGERLDGNKTLMIKYEDERCR